MSKDRGLSYTLIYNLVRGRIRTLSARDYKIIFGEDPPLQEIERVDGEYFRKMVGNEYEGDATLGSHRREQVEDLSLDRKVEGGDGLVQYQDLWFNR